jgi:3-hydroxy-3-methylglutaryl CoA synthase
MNSVDSGRHTLSPTDKQTVSGWYTPVKMNFTVFFDLITLPNNHFIIATDKAIYAGTATLKPGTMTISALGSVRSSLSICVDTRMLAAWVSR